MQFSHIHRAQKDLLNAGFTEEDIKDMDARWSETHRVYHGHNHLAHLLDLIDADASTTADEKSDLRVLAVTHDVVNHPMRPDNEARSAEYYATRLHENHKQDIYDAILDTKDHTKPPKNKLSGIFINYDLHNLLHGSLSDLIKDSHSLVREYGAYDWSQMKQGRIAFMRNIEPFIKQRSADTHVSEYIEWLQWYQPRIAAFAGTFFPMHKGHVDVLHKAERIFDKVIVACGTNPMKKDYAERVAYVDAIRQMLPNNQVEPFSGFLTKYIKEKTYPVTIVKGLRNPTDFDYEKMQLRYMEDMEANLDIVYIMSAREYEHVSSSGIQLVKHVETLEKSDEGLYKKYLVNGDNGKW